MIYSFEGQLISEGNRSYIEIPFNVWEEAGLNGNLPARVKVNDYTLGLEPDIKVEIEILETILHGGDRCRFQITKN